MKLIFINWVGKYLSILFSVCCVTTCHAIYDVKLSHGAPGGLSHGYCKSCTDKIRREYGRL